MFDAITSGAAGAFDTASSAVGTVANLPLFNQPVWKAGLGLLALALLMFVWHSILQFMQ